LARKCVVETVVDTDAEVEPKNKRLCTEPTIDSSVASSNKVWECHRNLQDSGATTDTDEERKL